MPESLRPTNGEYDCLFTVFISVFTVVFLVKHRAVYFFAHGILFVRFKHFKESYGRGRLLEIDIKAVMAIGFHYNNQ